MARSYEQNKFVLFVAISLNYITAYILAFNKMLSRHVHTIIFKAQSMKRKG